jgi:hypothetical protein
VSTVLDQVSADRSADDAVKVHRSGVVNCSYPTGSRSTSQPGCATGPTVHCGGFMGLWCL